MNLSVYVIEDAPSGYAQYPNDYTEDIFRRCIELSDKPSQMIVHRDGHLMYYAYVRRLSESKRFGICVVVNGLMITDFKRMFILFENTVESLLVSGNILQLTSEGELDIIDTPLHQDEDVTLLRERMIQNFSTMEQGSAELPPVDYSVSSSEVHTMSIDDDSKALFKSSYKYGYSVIAKEKDMESANMRGFRSKLAGLTKENATLKEENAKILRQKNNVKWVMILSVTLIVIMLVGVGVYSSMSDTKMNLQSRLSEAEQQTGKDAETIEWLNKVIDGNNKEMNTLNQTIWEKDITINSQARSITVLENTNSSLESQIASQGTAIVNLEKDKASLNKTIKGHLQTIETLKSQAPAEVKVSMQNVQFEFSSGNLLFDYTSTGNEQISLLVVITDSKGKIESFERKSFVYKGSYKKQKLFIKKGYNAAKQYTLEIYLADQLSKRKI